MLINHNMPDNMVNTNSGIPTALKELSKVSSLGADITFSSTSKFYDSGTAKSDQRAPKI